MQFFFDLFYFQILINTYSFKDVVFMKNIKCQKKLPFNVFNNNLIIYAVKHMFNFEIFDSLNIIIAMCVIFRLEKLNAWNIP